MNEFTVSEAELALAVGLSRETVKKARREMLDASVDFGLVGGKVCLTKDAARRLLAGLGLKDVVSIALDGDRVACANGDGVDAKNDAASLTVCGLTKNRRVVMARTDGNEVVRLVVPRSDNFIEGMRVPRCVEVGPGLWKFAGRCPRWRGRW